MAELRWKSTTEKWDSKQLEQAFASFVHTHGAPRFPLTIRLTELAQEFGDARAEAFWQLFVTERKQSDELPYMTESNPVEEQPLILASPGEALCAAGPLLAHALMRKLGGILMQAEPLRSQVMARRDRALEQRVLSVFKDFLGDTATYLPSAYEQSDSQYEHDLIICIENKIFIVEAKASPPIEPFRDPEKAYVRIRDHFRSKRGPQKAHDQANQLRRKLLNQKQLSLFRKDGAELATLKIDPSSQVFCICVTADSYGILATDLSLLLEKPAHEPYPWVAGINDIEAFFKGLRRKKWGADHLALFLEQRAVLHGRVFTTDELEIAGLFLRYGTLEALLAPGQQKFLLNPDFAQIFDNLYREEQGGPPAQLDPEYPLAVNEFGPPPSGLNRRELMEFSRERMLAMSPPQALKDVGRNDPCPCGSGKKFKRCCLNNR
jgi:hypothetical protein